jgi:hypothetical protein
MSDETEPSAPPQNDVKLLSHGRILKLMGVLGLAGSVLGSLFISLYFGLGVLAGSVLAFANYYWLKFSLKKVFDLTRETGQKPRLLGLKFFGRYVALAAVVAMLYATDAVSVIGLILGLGSFGFSVVLEGIFRIFSGPGQQGQN